MNFDDLMRQEYGTTLVDEPAPGSQHARVRDLETILNIVRKINTSLVLSDTLEFVIDQAIRITKAERGFLMLADPDGTLRFVVGRSARGESIHAESFELSASVLEEVFHSGESMCIENALTDERFEERRSIMALELQTIICSPLRTQDETIGVIYVDSKHIQSINKADILSIFEILTGQAAIAIKNARLYEDLRSTYEDLKEANTEIIKFERMASKGQIAVEVSHELKNLVAVVILSLQVLQRRIGDTVGSEIQTIVNQALQGAQKIQHFSQSLLTRTRATGNLQPLSLNKVIGDFVEFMRFMPKFKKSEINLSLDQNIPDILLDVDQIQQVLLNLVNNAVEASPEATLRFNSRLLSDQNLVELRVQDNGPGIDGSIVAKLLHEKITTKEDGHGFGLTICRQIIEEHGGSIRIESELSVGTTFVVTFPLQKER